MFMTGSSIINIPGPLIGKANNGAWLSLLLSGGLGFLLLSCMLFLYRRFPDMTYVEYSRKLIGTTLTVIFSVCTMSLFIQMQAGIVIDVSLFMVSSMLRETPMYVFSFLVYAISAATARAGLEVMARMFTLILILITFFIIAVLLVAIPDYDPSNLLPVMPKGIKPVLHGAYFSFGFPYAEVFLFSMLFPFVNKSSSPKLCKIMLITLGLNHFYFVFIHGVRHYGFWSLCRGAAIRAVFFGADYRVPGNYSKDGIHYRHVAHFGLLYENNDYLVCV